MSVSPVSTTRVAFVDFMYAIVVGTAFALVAPVDLSFRFVGLLVLILVVLEDFYLYHTQIAVHAHRGIPSFSALAFEISILLAWYLAAASFPDAPHAFLAAMAAFFVLKWSAGLAHFGSLGELRSWRFHRNHAFILTAGTCAAVAVLNGSTAMEAPRMWLPVLVAWILQLGIWWSVTRSMERREGKR